MATDETTFITQVHPVTIGEVRDEGVQSLILLAASLDWNVLKKHNQPVVLTARDGTQKRLPTDSSCKMSVFQSALSTIMVHTADDMIPTIDLMDKIIAKVKPSVDHARRLRLAVGETVADHRNRINAIASGAGERKRDEEHLTQRVELPPIVEVSHQVNTILAGENTSALREGLMVPTTPPHDGEEHGELVSREPFRAHYSGSAKGGGYTYESVASFERIWEDGYRDYECQLCGKAYGSPRAAGSHRQVHTKTGEVELDTRYMTEEYRAKHRVSRGKRREEQVEFVDELPVEVFTASDGEAAIRVGEVEHEVTPEVAEDALLLLEAISKLMYPRLARKYEERQAELITERDEALKRLAEVEGEFDALVEMLTSRKKDR